MGSPAVTVTDNLRVRTAPEISDASARLDLLNAGTGLLVLDGPSGGLQLRAVQDATGAGQVPTGGAAAGGGWAAQGQRGPALAAGSVLVGASAVGVVVLVRRRRMLDGA